MRKNATKLAAAVLSLAMVMTSVSVPASAAKTKKAKLNKTKATLYTNGSKSQKSTTLKLTVGGKKVKATFKSSNTKLLTVGKTTGKVTAKKNGTATVTATYKKKAYKCKITVKTYATSVTTNVKTLNLTEGKTATIKTTVKPSTASNKKVSFTSNNKSAATVSSKGKVTAKKAGTAKITVTALGSKNKAKKAYVTVKVKKAATTPTATPEVTPTATPEVTPTAVPTETPSVATEGTITVTTNVTGAAVEILDGTKVVASGSTLDVKSFKTGKIPNGTYAVNVSKEGYKPQTKTVVVNGSDETVDVVLEEIKEEEVKATLKDALKIRETKVQVNFTNKIAVPTKDNFAIAGLTITDVALTEDQKSVILTVSDKLELDKTYTVSTKNIVDANGEAVTDGTVDFTARKVEYIAVMQITDPETGEVTNELKSDGADTAKVEVTLYDNANHIVKDDAEITFTATAGNFAEKKVTVQNGVASILFTSEISSTKIESLLTATVTESSNAELKNTKIERRINLNPNIDGQKDQTVGASLTDVMVETCDRVVLFFNKEVNVANYTKNTEAEKYAYDASKMEIKILDNAKTKESIADTDNTKSPIALYPVKDNPKALYAILDTDNKNKDDYLTDNAKVLVKVTDKTKTIPVTDTKNTLVSDIRTPSILDVKQNGLRSIDVIFSEPVQNGVAKNADKKFVRPNSAEIVDAKETDKWVIDTRTLSDPSWGVNGSRAKAEVGKFDVKTGVDRRNVVTITLGKKDNGDQIYFTAGKHSVQGNKIGDWANVTDINNNFINTQTLDFTIEADETAPKMDVKVESPEQYYVTFNTDVDVAKVKANLKLQQYKDNTWKNIGDINIRQVGTSQKEFIVELTRDWTDILETYSSSKKNYYNYSFRLHMDEKVLTNLSNGLKNAEINCNLDDDIMKNPDVTSPKLKDVSQNGQESVIIEFNEPAQINGFKGEKGDGHQITPTIEQKKAQDGDLSLPIIQFISEDNSKTIKGRVDSVNENDTKIYVKPEDTLTAGTWKVVVRNVSDDVGNTAETLVKNDFVVKGDIHVDSGFRVRWIVAVQKDHYDPIAGKMAADDIIYVKFNKQIKTYGSAANAGATTNYTVNDYTLPTSKIDAFIDRYNDKASNYGYSDIVAIHLKDTALTDSSNTININKTLESATGAPLANGGKFLLSKEYRMYGDYIFTWKYNYYSETKEMKVSDVQKLLDDEAYDSFKFVKDTITDLDGDKTTFDIKHSGTVDFDDQKVHELHINTMETGTLEVKNVKADKVTIYAPYAEVKLDGVTVKKQDISSGKDIGEIEVIDILDGTLTLENTKADILNVTDSNAGAINLEGGRNVIGSVVIDTTGTITLEDASAGEIPNGVTIKKACTLHVKNATAQFIVKIDKTSVDPKNVTITEDKNGSVDVKDSDSNSIADFKVKPEVAKGVTLNINKDNATGVTGYEGSKAKTTVKITNGTQKDAGSLDVTVGVWGKTETKTVKVSAATSAAVVAKEIVEGVNKEDPKLTNYTISLDKNDPTETTLLIEAKDVGAGKKFDVTISDNDSKTPTGVKAVTLNHEDGKDTVEKRTGYVVITPNKDDSIKKLKDDSGNAGKYVSNVDGTLKITVNGVAIDPITIKGYSSTVSDVVNKIIDNIKNNKAVTDKDGVLNGFSASETTAKDGVIVTAANEKQSVTVSYVFE